MVLSDERVRGCMKRLLMSRLRLLCNQGFYGLLLMHMVFSLDSECETVGTDGKRIFFNPEFLERISDSELDYVMMHEILHVVLRHHERRGGRDEELFDIACDIVVDANILYSNGMKMDSITIQGCDIPQCQTPTGEYAYKYTAEEVYEMLVPVYLPANKPSIKLKSQNNDSSPEEDSDFEMKIDSSQGGGGIDDHSRWNSEKSDGEEDESYEKDRWQGYFVDACEAMKIRDSSKSQGSIPAFAERMLLELRKSQIDWRRILNEFVQEEITDYSFMPPDRRFDDCPFFLPDFNDKSFVVEDILFMIDGSGSMSDDEITAAYSEVKGAIDQFDGKLKGWLGFFDAVVYEPKEFVDEDEFRIIRPAGGGGTNFHIIFNYVKKKMVDNHPKSIIILTDGFADFPDEQMAEGIPVLWLLNNEEVAPPWGKVARITVD